MKQSLVTLLTFMSICAFAQPYSIHGTPYIEVAGEGKLEVIPNEIFLHVYINEKDKGKETLEEIEAKMITALTKLGIDPKEQLQVASFKSNFNYGLFSPTINTSKSYELKLTDLAQVPKVFIELEKVGISNTYVYKTDHSDMEELKMQVKIQAVRSARDKATNMLNELGQGLGRTLFLEEKGDIDSYAYRADRSNYRTRLNSVGAVSRAVAPSDQPELDFTKFNLQYNVMVRFEIE